jgi:hypothetical protein
MTVLKELEDGRSKQNARACVVDARAKDAENIKLFSTDQIAAGETLYQKAATAWFRSKVYRNYRENFIAVKVDRPTSADKLTPEVEALEEFVKANGIERAARSTSIVYRIKLV